MELKLENGRYVPSVFKGLSRVDGVEELCQRVTMKLVAPKGDFLPNPRFGSRLGELSSIKQSCRENAAKQFVSEALSDEEGLELQNLQIIYGNDGEMELYMEFSYDGKMIFDLQTKI